MKINQEFMFGANVILTCVGIIMIYRATNLKTKFDEKFDDYIDTKVRPVLDKKIDDAIQANVKDARIIEIVNSNLDSIVVKTVTDNCQKTITYSVDAKIALAYPNGIVNEITTKVNAKIQEAFDEYEASQPTVTADDGGDDDGGDDDGGEDDE
jgi:hypothetical protein